MLMVIEGRRGGQYLTRYPSGQLVTFPGMEIEENIFVVPCSSLDCFYLGTEHVVSRNVSVWKVYKGIDDKFTIVKWCILGSVGICKASAGNEGCLLTYWKNIRTWEHVVKLFDSNGWLTHSWVEPIDDGDWFLVQRLMLLNGHMLNLYEQLIIGSKLRECNIDGELIREYRFDSLVTKCIVDRHDRVIAFNLQVEWNALIRRGMP